MKAVLLEGYGGSEVLRLGELPRPVPEGRQVLVEVLATSVNPIDWKLRKHGGDWAPEPGGVLHGDLAGRVAAVGPQATRFQVGDAVYGCAGGLRGYDGALAEFMRCDEELLAAKPETLDWRQAAALPLVTLTAWEGLIDRARLQPGERVLVQGGAGGVGHVAIQLAKAAGAWVAATVSSAAKAEVARRCGADATIDYRREAPADYAARLTGGAGFDLAFDTIGASAFAASIEALRPGGRLVTIAATEAFVLAPAHARGLDIQIVLMLLPMLTGRGKARQGELLAQAARLADMGRLAPVLDPRAFTLAEAAAAHDRQESGEALGKMVITVGPA
ncbi:NADPH2:quinone reductase [Tistlia consotensis]|uniref:NADPH2:quinone reductase n=1 Tax=Tistlia consotensis USBA 355 TaxID=560819 RepID=A0A1Y6C4T0_9PROT|nr:zinc-binding dehydrogenase [Tistlia consotensis]SMF45696.1 NADPH2:quinone reductase [Tistlia consotensis USBA 355]SNR79459.1 NADPH2:quinone reductase [Tistlia consotensis]